MRNRLVPRTEWTSFFGEFSRRYQGWLVTVRILNPAYGSQVEARDLPLEGVVSGAGGSGPISLHLGGSVEKNVEHEVPSPRQVWVEISETGAEEALGSCRKTERRPSWSSERPLARPSRTEPGRHPVPGPNRSDRRNTPVRRSGISGNGGGGGSRTRVRSRHPPGHSMLSLFLVLAPPPREEAKRRQGIPEWFSPRRPEVRRRYTRIWQRPARRGGCAPGRTRLLN